MRDQIKEGAGVAYSPIKKTKLLKDGNAMSFAQERLWFLNEFEGSNENYNIPIILRLEGKLDIKALEIKLKSAYLLDMHLLGQFLLKISQELVFKRF